jgi:hypothetical protein
LTPAELLEHLDAMRFVLSRPAYVLAAVRRAAPNATGEDVLADLLTLARLYTPILRGWGTAPDLRDTGFSQTEVFIDSELLGPN